MIVHSFVKNTIYANGTIVALFTFLYGSTESRYLLLIFFQPP